MPKNSDCLSCRLIGGGSMFAMAAFTLNGLKRASDPKAKVAIYDFDAGKKDFLTSAGIFFLVDVIGFGNFRVEILAAIKWD